MRRPLPSPTKLLTGALCAAVAAVCLAAPADVHARQGAPAEGMSNELPRELEGVDVKNKLGETLDGELTFTDHEGREVTLGDYFDGERPVLLTLNYYTCESACTVQLNNLLDPLTQIGWRPGDDTYRIVTISFDPRDGTDVARGKRETYTRALASRLADRDGDTLEGDALARDAAALDWAFLTGEPDMIRALTAEAGYAVNYDADSGQYAHAPVIYVLAPDGTISRYLWGLTYPAQDLKFALMDASDGEIGSFGDKILASCFVFDPDGGGYVAFAFGFMRIGAVAIAFGIGLWLFFMWRRERRRARATGSRMWRRGGTDLREQTSLEGT